MSAKYHFAEGQGGWFNRQLVRAQKMDFTQFQVRANERARRTTIVGGQCSAFRFSAIDEVTRRHRRAAPWTNETATEDAQLGLELQEMGWTTVMSATARAQVGAMPTVRALSGQRAKWNAGLIAHDEHAAVQAHAALWLQHIGLASTCSCAWPSSPCSPPRSPPTSSCGPGGGSPRPPSRRSNS